MATERCECGCERAKHVEVPGCTACPCTGYVRAAEMPCPATHMVGGTCGECGWDYDRDKALRSSSPAPSDDEWRARARAYLDDHGIECNGWRVDHLANLLADIRRETIEECAKAAAFAGLDEVTDAIRALLAKGPAR